MVANTITRHRWWQRGKGVLSAALLAAVLFGFGPLGAGAATIKARDLALKLTTQAENGSGYARTAFTHWIDADHDGCDTRKEVLLATTKTTPVMGDGCKVISGTWRSFLDGKYWTDPADLDIDHLVALKEAWDSGAKVWTKTNRTRFANDLDYKWTLEAVTDNVNASKGDRDPAEWLPPLVRARCAYVARWVGVKYRWRLTVDKTERTKILTILSGTCGATVITVPTRAI